ncbi:arginine N-succinyltransferase [Silvimonas iriomotensis]|uniref:Arginine N-succinyltransferase subunit alpha n=1 Tax=Silvimonas iriomotensis TaxID=449662 RepID=A0ABQ2PDA1_9NEIS|nr:arginine N-succinyltransferase [Silvimonas iriomotensis]GGP23130.1 arginine N-succinyltransferase subunit alpha [Silvimonas iriomotensis]
MLFVRPGKPSDLDDLERMARETGPVLHSLPPDRERLARGVQQSTDSLESDVEYPGEETYLFVLEDSATGRVCGTAGIVAMAGFSEPFYVFRNEVVVHASRALKVNHRVHALVLSHEMTGRTRLTGFYVDQATQRQSALAAHLLSRARILFAAQNRERFTNDIFAVLPGITDATGHSPFWEGVGYKFFKRDFKQMEIESGGRSRTFIAEMMPVDPLYVPLLSEDAQRVMGEPHHDALPNYECHLAEGLEPDKFVDIFDAGPVLTCVLDVCQSVRLGSVRHATRGKPEGGCMPWLISNLYTTDFRCVTVMLPETPPATLTLPPEVFDVLDIAEGDLVRCAPVGGLPA